MFPFQIQKLIQTVRLQPCHSLTMETQRMWLPIFRESLGRIKWKERDKHNVRNQFIIHINSTTNDWRETVELQLTWCLWKCSLMCHSHLWSFTCLCLVIKSARAQELTSCYTWMHPSISQDLGLMFKSNQGACILIILFCFHYVILHLHRCFRRKDVHMENGRCWCFFRFNPSMSRPPSIFFRSSYT